MVPSWQGQIVLCKNQAAGTDGARAEKPAGRGSCGWQSQGLLLQEVQVNLGSWGCPAAWVRVHCWLPGYREGARSAVRSQQHGSCADKQELL